jgi:hypothetical protein
MNLAELQLLFPVTNNTMMTGRIPMSFVNEHLDEIKQIVKDNSLRRFYRGPRPFAYATDTRKADAVAMILYRKF